ncbi:methyltransferase domain-containing protein [Ideonella sp. DXS29W]|uniref:Methyltransferase domain-containing protein n=1 Tax=Ideonella lacteola TaxID=2984193 RepID=A0ABU9BNE4_9BURK
MQVDASHYKFERYVDIKRWCSYWHQLREVLALQPRSVLEVGVGNGINSLLLRQLGCETATMDIDPALNPTHVGSVTAIPLADASYDVVAAFQVLEHLPYDNFRTAVSELRRVSTRYVVLSLPDSHKMLTFVLPLPFGGERRIQFAKPRWRARVHRITGEHQWEINKRGYPVSRIVDDLRASGLEVLRTFRAPENPYHRFFICRK